MSDYRPADLPLPPDDFDGSRPSPTLSPADAAVIGGLGHLPSPLRDGSGTPPVAAAVVPAPQAARQALLVPPSDGRPPKKGQVVLSKSTLCRLREARCMSQEELVHDFERRNIRVSIATIKRAETGHAVRYRIVRELARYYGVSFDDLLH
jgi:hypothetical protein